MLWQDGEPGSENWPAEERDCCESVVFVRTGRGMGWLGVAMVVDVKGAGRRDEREKEREMMVEGDAGAKD